MSKHPFFVALLAGLVLATASTPSQAGFSFTQKKTLDKPAAKLEMAPGSMSGVSQIGVGMARKKQSAGENVVLSLTPDPIVLEGIAVVMDRFERRRRAFPHASQVVDREELMVSPGSNLAEIIRRESFLQLTRCSPSYFQEFCAVVRGRLRPVRVYVDEMPAMGGSDYLDFLKPWELHLVEIYYSVGQVRVYTERFMERVGRRPVAIQPIGW